MFRIIIILVVAGGALIFFGYQELRLSRVAKETPQTIPCADLAARGPGDNAHITLTDFDLGANYVYEGRSETSSWTKAFVPAIPRVKNLAEALQAKSSPQIKVIIKSSKVRSKSDMDSLALTSTIQGLVTNEIESLGRDERKLLKESYPAVDFDKVWILDHGRQPAGTGKVFAFLGGGTALAAAAIGLFIVRRKSQ
jgi:hypothetical protein